MNLENLIVDIEVILFLAILIGYLVVILYYKPTGNRKSLLDIEVEEEPEPKVEPACNHDFVISTINEYTQTGQIRQKMCAHCHTKLELLTK